MWEAKAQDRAPISGGRSNKSRVKTEVKHKSFSGEVDAPQEEKGEDVGNNEEQDSCNT
jgi:hypothetical protein